MSDKALFKMVSYNVLASSYIRAEHYPYTPAEWLDDRKRIPALVQYILDLKADLYCLQEVEERTFNALNKAFSPIGYSGQLALKGHAKPDGCAIFFKQNTLKLIDAIRFEYQDNVEQSTSGHIAQIMILEFAQDRFAVANTHLKWDPAGLPTSRQYGYQQASELIATIESGPYKTIPWIICGDLNAEITSDPISVLHAAGFHSSHMDIHAGATCNANSRSRMIDFIFYQSPLMVNPLPIPIVDDSTPLPGPTEPSDHVPVMAEFELEYANNF